MKNIIYLLIIFSCIYLAGCEDSTGSLQAEKAHYPVDTTVFKAVLDPNNPEDARQLELGYPFSTNEITGVLGTQPIYYEIQEIRCDNGSAEAAKQFYLSGKAKIQLSGKHTVPPGYYDFRLKIQNEKGCYYTDFIKTIKVE